MKATHKEMLLASLEKFNSCEVVVGGTSMWPFIKDGDIVGVSSRRGKVKVKVKATDVVPKGVASLTFHFHETPTNELTICAVDPIAKIPETKVCSVKVERL